MSPGVRPDAGAILELRSLAGGYERLTVFRDISCAIRPGQCIGLLGPNGAGKTALLKTISGSLPAHAGSVLLEGCDITRQPAYRRARVGLVLVPQGRHIFGHLSVRDNLELTRTVERHRADLGPFEERLAEIHALFPVLRERLDQSGGSLSGGEQQMLAIARALLLKPTVLMLDEPTQGLAPIIIHNLAETLQVLKGRFAIVVVEQNKRFLDGLADSIVQLRAGNLTAA